MEDKTIILDHSMFEESGLSRIDTMIKRYSTDPIYELQTLKNGTVLVLSHRSQAEPSGGSVSVFDLANNKMIPLTENEDVVHMAASPNGTSILFHSFRDDKPQTVWLDAAENREKGRWVDNSGAWQIMLDDRHVVEIFESDIRVRNLETNEINVLANFENGKRNTPKEESFSGPVLKRTLAMALSPDRTRLYLPSFLPWSEEGVSSIYKIDMNTGALDTTSFNAKSDLYDISPLSKEKLVLSGRINEVEGLYSVLGKGEPELLKEGVYSQLTYNPNRGTIAYASLGDGRWKVMAAKLDDRGLSDEFTVYDNLGYISSIQWSADGETLLVVTDENTGSNVYQFRMK